MMNKLTIPLAMACLLLTILLASISYYCFDRIIALDYCRGENSGMKRQQELLMSLLLRTGKPMTRKQWQTFLKNEFGDHLIKEVGNQVSVDNILLTFKDEELVEIKSSD